jgi:hypothetical protein
MPLSILHLLIYYIHCDFWETTKHWIPASYKRAYFYRYRYNNYYHTSFLVTASKWTYVAGRWATDTLHVTCKNQYKGIGLYSPLVLLMGIAFVVSMVAVIYCFCIGPCKKDQDDESTTPRTVYVEGESDVPYQKVED